MLVKFDKKLFQANQLGARAFFDLWELEYCFSGSKKANFNIATKNLPNSIVVPDLTNSVNDFFNLQSEINTQPTFVFGKLSTVSGDGEIIGNLTGRSGIYNIKYDAKLNCVFLPFNPFTVIENFLLEKYLNDKRVAFSVLQSLVYRFLPDYFKDRSCKFFFKARLRESQELFPKWPTDNSLVYLYDFILGCIELITGNYPKKRKIWPKDYQAALLLTHDLDTLGDFKNISTTLRIEDEFGYTSDWFVVPKSPKYNIRGKELKKKLKMIADSGRNLNVHDYRHDGRLFKHLNGLKPEDFKKAFLPHNNKISGFRSQHLFRGPALLDFLNGKFDYDSSYIDSECDSLYAKSSGCLSYFPFFYKEILEIPLTLAQDCTLLKSFNMGTKKALEIWINKTETILENNGLINILIHPSLAGSWYKDLLSYLKTKNLWNTTMPELNKWWRSNTQRSLEARE